MNTTRISTRPVVSERYSAMKGVRYLEYRVSGQLHRTDGPAVMGSDGSFKYYERGVLHRENGPAVYIPLTGETAYYRRGLLHRDSREGPALEYLRADGLVQYYRDGKLHRDSREGPAHSDNRGMRAYFYDGQLHRDSREGPAWIPDRLTASFGVRPLYYEWGQIRHSH